MSEELPSIGQPLLPNETKETNIEIPGDRNKVVLHADEVKNTIQVVVNSSRGRRHGARKKLYTMNTSYYNLFVVEGEEYEEDEGTFQIATDLALTESITEELKRKYARLDESAIEDIKTFPTIFTNKNHHFGYTDNDHYACYGVVTGVERDGHHIIISYHILGDLKQQDLINMAEDLGILKASEYNELNDPHWTIKEFNLIAAMKKTGVELVTIT